MTKLIILFRNFAKVPKIVVQCWYNILVGTTYVKPTEDFNLAADCTCVGFTRLVGKLYNIYKNVRD